MRTRTPGMWWGPALEALDAGGLAKVLHTAAHLAPAPREQRPMMHLDLQVGDVEDALDEAVASGARLSDHQPHSNVRVLFDPAGHPFCPCRDDG